MGAFSRNGKSYLLLFASADCFSQQGNNWVMGWHVGMNFNTKPPSFYNTNICRDNNNSNTGTQCPSSISDCLGNLLFYSNGDDIWNRFNGLMPHNLKDTFNNGSYNSIILPYPKHDSLYFVFRIGGGIQNGQYQNNGI